MTKKKLSYAELQNEIARLKEEARRTKAEEARIDREQRAEAEACIGAMFVDVFGKENWKAIDPERVRSFLDGNAGVIRGMRTEGERDGKTAIAKFRDAARKTGSAIRKSERQNSSFPS